MAHIIANILSLVQYIEQLKDSPTNCLKINVTESRKFLFHCLITNVTEQIKIKRDILP